MGVEFRLGGQVLLVNVVGHSRRRTGRHPEEVHLARANGFDLAVVSAPLTLPPPGSLHKETFSNGNTTFRLAVNRPPRRTSK